MIYTMMSLLWIAGTIPFMIFSVIRLSAELHMLQQNSYRNDRYNGWLKERGRKQYTDFLGLLPVFPVMVLEGFFSELVALILWVMVYVLFIRGRDKTPPKKPLVFTERATRLYVVALALYFVPTVMLLFLGVANMGAADVARGICLLILAVMPFFSPVFMLLGNTLAQPFEEHKKSEYFDDAKSIVEAHDGLIKVAITGSFGKTSVKHVLNRMLEEKYYTLMPPGSYNTPMGLTRVIREQLKPIHEVFLAEMGAKQKGDIAELCDLIAPKFGMITALGEAHLESFGSFENIVDTKFELVEALPEDGIAVLNFDDAAIRANAHRMRGSVITYGIHGDDLDFWAEKIRYNDRGMEFILHSKDGAAIEMRTRLLGEHNVLNIVGAAAMANYLGVSYKQMKRAVLSLAPVEHRLELRSTANGFHIIDDAFNSNPVGAAAAMDVLKRMEGGKKFLVTPGMIELGEREYEENKKFGVKAAESCDYIALVGENQTAAVREGILEAGFPEENLFVALNLNEANAFVFSKMEKGDYILYENDLPDTYNE